MKNTIFPSLKNNNTNSIVIVRRKSLNNSANKKNHYKIEIEKLYDQNVHYKKTIKKLQAEINEIKNELSKKQKILSSVNSEITPLTPEIMSRQATMNIGTIGHVAHGKTTLVRAISGIQTTKHKIEKERNITYFLGYANAKLYKCPKCPDLEAYQAYGSTKEDQPKCEKCGERLELLRHISFVDCPGHDILMATMLNGASVMDAALLLVAANIQCPQPQTREHLAAVENMDLENIIIVQNT